MTEELLRTFREQVADDRVAAALETVDDLEAAFAADRARTAANDVVATAVRYNTDGDSAAAANDHLEAATELEQRRVELNEAILGYLTVETPPDVVVSRVDAALDAYRTLAAKREALLAVADGVRTGVLLHLAAVEGFRVPKGSSVAVTTELANLGSAGSGPLAVTASADDGVSTAVSPTSLDGLAAGEETAVGVEVGGESTGVARVRLVVEGEEAESTAFRVEVLDKADFLSEALANAERLLSDVEDRVEPGRAGGSLEGLRNRFEEIVRRLEQILDRVGNGTPGGRGDSVDHRIRSVTNRFDSVVNTLENGDETGPGPRVVSEYVRRCRDSVDLLESAIEAAE